jgi:hypothetical protein
MFRRFREFQKYKNLKSDRDVLKQYLENFQFDIDKVGKRIAEGMQHFVYEYGENEVIKFPKFDLTNLTYGILNPVAAEKDWQLIAKNFAGFCVPTRIYSSTDKRLYCIVQERIHNRLNLTSHNIELVMDQFNEIYTRNKKLEETTGYSLDLWGKSGILKSINKSFKRTNIFIEMTNLVIEKNNDQYKIRIIDTNLFKIRFELNYVFRVFTDRIIYSFSDFVLKKAKFLIGK